MGDRSERMGRLLLKEPAFFAQVKIDEYGAPTWPNGADLAPDAIYERLVALQA